MPDTISTDKNGVPAHLSAAYARSEQNSIVIRRLFLMAGAVMLLGTPLFWNYLNELPNPVLLSILAVTSLAVAAGMTDLHRKWTALADLFVAIQAITAFTYYALLRYGQTRDLFDPFFVANEALAAIFFLALYFSANMVQELFFKTAHARVLEILSRHGKDEQELKEIFWKQLAILGDPETVAEIITSDRYVDEYLEMKERGDGEFAIANAFRRKFALH